MRARRPRVRRNGRYNKSETSDDDACGPEQYWRVYTLVQYIMYTDYVRRTSAMVCVRACGGEGDNEETGDRVLQFFFPLRFQLNIFFFPYKNNDDNCLSRGRYVII